MDTTARLSLALLGSFEVTLDGQPVTTFESVKVRALLAYLAVEAGRSHARAFLAELLWPDLPAATALTYLRHVLAKLRQAIPDSVPSAPPFLLITRESIALNPGGDYCLDVASFTAFLESCASHPHRYPETCRSCARRRAAAVALYRGDFLAHFLLGDSAAFEEWAALKRERLRQLMLDALARLATYYERRGAYQAAQQFAWHLAELDSWGDEACQQLMRVLWLSGQRSAALEHYARYQRILQQELGVEPAAETTVLYQRIRDAATSTPSNESPSPLHNLPAQTTSLIGREAELAQLADLLQQPTYRLITLSGAGGIGKTRLALQVAAELLDDFADGVCFVALAPISDPNLVIPAIAQALGVQESNAQPLLKSLTVHLRARQMLLVLDNFEQVSAAATVVADLLAACPRLTILVTSREVLCLYGEHEFPVPPLSLPDVHHLPALPDLNQYEAVRLFVARAQAVHPNFAVTDETAPAVAEICRRLDGLPLAIELAAARIWLPSPPAMLQRLGRLLTFLTGGGRDPPARHQTLRATINWSYNLLPVGEQQLLARLAVFVGGWTLEAAEAICAAGAALPIATFDGVEALVAKSLVRRQRAEIGGIARTPRFGMLEAIREYALERLEASSESEVVRSRHLLFFRDLAEAAEPHLTGPDHAVWIDMLKAEHGNLQAALVRSQAADQVELGLRLAGALWRFWLAERYFSDGRDWLALFLTRARSGSALDTAPQIRSKALLGAGTIINYQGDAVRAGELLSESLALARALGDTQGVAWALNELGEVAFRRDDYTQARRLREESLMLFHECDDRGGMVAVLGNLGRVARERGNHDQARAFFQESLALSRELGDANGMAIAFKGLGTVARRQGDDLTARTLYEQSLALFRTLEDRWGVALSLDALGGVAQRQGNDTMAVVRFEECLALYREFGDRRNVAFVLRKLGLIAHRRGDVHHAHTLLVESLGLFRALGKPRNTAYALIYVGLTALSQNDTRQATVLLRESLMIFQSLAQPAGLAETLAGLAWAAHADGQPERAARILAAVGAFCEASGTPSLPSHHGGLAHTLGIVRSQLDAVAFETTWEGGGPTTLDQAIAEILGET